MRDVNIAKYESSAAHFDLHIKLKKGRISMIKFQKVNAIQKLVFLPGSKVFRRLQYLINSKFP